MEKTVRHSILEPGAAVACRDAEDALRRIEMVQNGLLGVAGIQAVRMSVDEEAGDDGEPEVIESLGDVPTNEIN